METGINITTQQDKESTEALSVLISDVFESGFKNHMDQDTIKKALDVVQQACSMNNLSINNCNLNG